MKNIFYYCLILSEFSCLISEKKDFVSKIKSTKDSCAALLASVVVAVLRNCPFTPYKTKVSQSVVGVATRYGLDGPGIESWLIFPTRPHRPFVLISCKMGTGSLSQR